MIDKYKKILINKGEVYLRIKARPGSSKTEAISIMDDDTIKINIAAVPEKGKANIELIKYLAKEFGVEKTKVALISGKAEKLKLVKIIL